MIYAGLYYIIKEKRDSSSKPENLSGEKMKKLFHSTTVLASLVLLTSLFISCSKKTELKPVSFKQLEVKKDNVTVCVDPRTEVLLIASRLAEVSFFANHDMDSDAYVNGIDKIMEKQKNHEFIKFLKSMTKNYKGGIYQLLTLSKYISEDFTEINFTKKTVPAEIEALCKNLDTKKFITLLNDFVNASNLSRVWLLYESFMKANLFDVSDFYDKYPNVTRWISEYFFDSSTKQNFTVHVSPIMNYYHILTPYYTSDGVNNFFICQSPGLNKVNNFSDINLAITMCESFYITYLREHYESFKNYIEKMMNDWAVKNNYTEKFQDFNYIGYATDWISNVTIINYIEKFSPEDSKEMFISSIESSLPVEDLLSLKDVFKYYDENRADYPTMESFLNNYLADYLAKLK